MPQNTEERILSIAREQFVQNGFSGTRMQEIADAADINKAMLHYYFRSKEKLYQKVVAQTVSQVVPAFAKAMEFKGSFWEKVETIISAYITVLLEHPDIPFFIMSELTQKRNIIVEEIKKQSSFIPSLQGFMGQAMMEMQMGKIREINPIQLMLNIMSMTVFPFIAKPIFSKVMSVSEDHFTQLMKERKQVVLDFIRFSLEIK